MEIIHNSVIKSILFDAFSSIGQKNLIPIFLDFFTNPVGFSFSEKDSGWVVKFKVLH